MKKFAIIIYLSIFCICSMSFKDPDTTATHICRAVSMLFDVNINKAPVHRGDYSKTAIVFRGQKLTAYQSKNGWVGFFKQISEQDLPVNAVSNMRIRYSDYYMTTALMFISMQGDIIYFTKMLNNKKCLILIINQAGEVGTFYPNGIQMKFN